MKKKRLVILVAATMFFLGFEMGGYQMVVADVSAEFGTNLTGLGLMVAAQYVSLILLPAVFGAVSDRVGRKRVMLPFGVLFVAGCGAAAASGGVGWFAAATVLIGAGFSVFEVIGTALMPDLYPEESARYINICQSSLSFGAVLGPLVILGYESLFGPSWRVMYLLCGAAFAVLLVPLWRSGFPVTSGESVKERSKTFGSPLRYFRSAIFLLMFLGVVVYVGLESGFGYFVGTLFDSELKSSSLGAYAISVYWLGMALSRVVFGMRKYPPYGVMIGCLAMAAALFVLLSRSPWAALSLAACFLIGAAYGPVWSTMVSEAAMEFPDSAAGAIGITSAGSGLGGILFPVLMGVAADFTDIRTAFLLLAATALLGGGLCALARLKKKER